MVQLLQNVAVRAEATHAVKDLALGDALPVTSETSSKVGLLKEALLKDNSLPQKTIVDKGALPQDHLTAADVEKSLQRMEVDVEALVKRAAAIAIGSDLDVIKEEPLVPRNLMERILAPHGMQLIDSRAAEAGDTSRIELVSVYIVRTKDPACPVVPIVKAHNHPDHTGREIQRIVNDLWREQFGEVPPKILAAATKAHATLLEKTIQGAVDKIEHAFSPQGRKEAMAYCGAFLALLGVGSSFATGFLTDPRPATVASAFRGQEALIGDIKAAVEFGERGYDYQNTAAVTKLTNAHFAAIENALVHSYNRPPMETLKLLKLYGKLGEQQVEADRRINGDRYAHSSWDQPKGDFAPYIRQIPVWRKNYINVLDTIAKDQKFHSAVRQVAYELGDGDTSKLENLQQRLDNYPPPAIPSFERYRY